MKTNLIQLEQVSKMVYTKKGPISIPNKGWLYTVRITLGMSARDAGKKAGVSAMAWVNAEKREVLGTISIGTLNKFLRALSCNLDYKPSSNISLKEIVERNISDLEKAKLKNIKTSMALENQEPSKGFTKNLERENIKRIISKNNIKTVWY